MMMQHSMPPQIMAQKPQRLDLAKMMAGMQTPGGGQTMRQMMSMGLQKLGQQRALQNAGMNNDYMAQGGIPVADWLAMR